MEVIDGRKEREKKEKRLGLSDTSLPYPFYKQRRKRELPHS